MSKSLVCFINKPMIYGLIFLGHNKHNSHVQRDALMQFAKEHHLTIDKFISFDKNPDISIFKPNDTIICYGWDCLCNDRNFLREFIQYLLNNNVFIYSVQSKYHIDKTMDMNALKYAFNMYMDIRFNFISNKNINGARQRVANGHAPGRPHGARGVNHIMDGKGATALKMHRDGFSMYAIARELGVSAPTIKRFLVAQN